MKRYNALLRGIREINSNGRVALCGYFLTGYNSPKNFYDCMKNLQNIDIIEYGIPSGNPFLDGPLISNAHDYVSNNLGINAEVAISIIGGLKDIPQPRFVMTYTQEGRDLEGFLKLCLLNDIHGIFAPDMNIEEAERVALITSSLGLAYIGFVHDQMNEAQIAKTVSICDIIYIKVSTGITGQIGVFSDELINKLEKRITELRKQKPQLLIATGIGIQTQEQVAILSGLDINMIIVGTSLMQKMHEGTEKLNQYSETLKKATNRKYSNSDFGNSVQYR